MLFHVTEPAATATEFVTRVNEANYVFGGYDVETPERTTFTIDIPLYALIEADIETLNDMIEGAAFSEGGTLSDINYSVGYDVFGSGETVRLVVSTVVETF